MPSAINWFQIPAGDIARAKTFCETICGGPLEKLESGPSMEMWASAQTDALARSAVAP